MLLPVRGIGPWSVDMFLMFALARPDVLPVGDLGVRKGMQRHFEAAQAPRGGADAEAGRALAAVPQCRSLVHVAAARDVRSS